MPTGETARPPADVIRTSARTSLLCYHAPSRPAHDPAPPAGSRSNPHTRFATLAKTPRKWSGARSPSGLKRVRQTERRHAVLGPRRTAAKTYVAKAVAAATGTIEGLDPQEALRDALSALDRAAKSGAIHANAAARRASRMTLKVNAALGGAHVPSTHVTKTTGKAAAVKAAKARIAAGKADKAKGAQTAAGKARAALSKTARAEAAAKSTAAKPVAKAPPKAKATATKTSTAKSATAKAAPKATARKTTTRKKPASE